MKKQKKNPTFFFCFIEVINNHEALSNTCGPEEVLLLRSGALGLCEKSPWQQCVCYGRAESKPSGKHWKWRGDTGRKRRDKEASEWGGRRGGGGSLPCQLCFQHLQQADLSWADAFASDPGRIPPRDTTAILDEKCWQVDFSNFRTCGKMTKKR